MHVIVETTGKRSALSRGAEVWICQVLDGPRNLDVVTLARHEDAVWSLRDEQALGLGTCLVTEQPARLELAPRHSRMTLSMLSHAWSGIVRVTVLRGEERFSRLVDLGTRGAPRLVQVSCTTDGIWLDEEENDAELRDADEDTPIAIAVPRWRGVFTATQLLFSHVMAVPRSADIAPEQLTREDKDRLIRQILSARSRVWVISGGDLVFLEVVREVVAIAPEKRFYLLFHGAFLALGMGNDRDILFTWLAAAREGVIAGILTMKPGMERLCTMTGARAAFLPVPFPEIDPATVAVPHEGATRLGIWLSRSEDPRKACPALPYALRTLRDVEVHAAGLSWDVATLMRRLNVRLGFHSASPIPQRRLHERLSAMDLNLYLTSSECSPILPLESFARGVPCIIGPATYYFEDDPVLRELLIVRDLARPSAIASTIEMALGRRSEILERYAGYARASNARSKELLTCFLNQDRDRLHSYGRSARVVSHG